MNQSIRPELEPLPTNMKDLPLDSRGYPVPWFVQWLKDESGQPYPEFRAMDLAKWMLAVKKHRCWVCGGQLGANLAFAIGPMCGITRTTSEPASHLSCAEWSARNCPFLSRPHMTRRDMENPEICRGAGIAIDRNPGVSLVWVARDCRIFNDGKGKPLISVGDPVSIGFWSEGRRATRAEIDASIDSGLPLLIAASGENSDEALAALRIEVEKFRTLLPAE